MIVNTPFFISPAYCVPRITNSPRSKETFTLVGEPTWSVYGFAGKSPAL